MVFDEFAHGEAVVLMWTVVDGENQKAVGVSTVARVSGVTDAACADVDLVGEDVVSSLGLWWGYIAVRWRCRKRLSRTGCSGRNRSILFKLTQSLARYDAMWYRSSRSHSKVLRGQAQFEMGFQRNDQTSDVTESRCLTGLVMRS